MSTREEWKEYKLKSLAPYEGALFRFQTYKAPSEEWTHDHCCGCWSEFAEYDAEHILHHGYVTTKPDQSTHEPEFITESKVQGMTCIPAPAISGYLLYWVCPDCFEEFCEILKFTLEPVPGIDNSDGLLG
jgi:hypothetical protein